MHKNYHDYLALRVHSSKYRFLFVNFFLSLKNAFQLSIVHFVCSFGPIFFAFYFGLCSFSGILIAKWNKTKTSIHYSGLYGSRCRVLPQNAISFYLQRGEQRWPYAPLSHCRNEKLPKLIWRHITLPHTHSHTHAHADRADSTRTRREKNNTIFMSKNEKEKKIIKNGLCTSMHQTVFAMSEREMIIVNCT